MRTRLFRRPASSSTTSTRIGASSTSSCGGGAALKAPFVCMRKGCGGLTRNSMPRSAWDENAEEERAPLPFVEAYPTSVRLDRHATEVEAQPAIEALCGEARLLAEDERALLRAHRGSAGGNADLELVAAEARAQRYGRAGAGVAEHCIHQA